LWDRKHSENLYVLVTKIENLQGQSFLKGLS